MENQPPEPSQTQKDRETLENLQRFWRMTLPYARKLTNWKGVGKTKIGEEAEKRIRFLGEITGALENTTDLPESLLKQKASLEEKEPEFLKQMESAWKLVESNPDEAETLISSLEKESRFRDLIAEESLKRVPPYIKLLCQFPIAFLAAHEWALAAEEETKGKDAKAYQRIEKFRKKWGEKPEPWIQENLGNL